MDPNVSYYSNRTGNGSTPYNNNNRSKNGNCQFYQGLASWPCPGNCRTEYKRPKVESDFPYARTPDLPSPQMLWSMQNSKGWKGWQYGSGTYGEGSLCCDQNNFKFKDMHPNPCKEADEGPNIRYVPLNWKNLMACNSYQDESAPICASQLQLRDYAQNPCTNKCISSLSNGPDPVKFQVHIGTKPKSNWCTNEKEGCYTVNKPPAPNNTSQTMEYQVPNSLLSNSDCRPIQNPCSTNPCGDFNNSTCKASKQLDKKCANGPNNSCVDKTCKFTGPFAKIAPYELKDIDEKLDSCCNISNEINPCKQDTEYLQCAKTLGISGSQTSCEQKNGSKLSCIGVSNGKQNGKEETNNSCGDGFLQKKTPSAFSNEACRSASVCSSRPSSSSSEATKLLYKNKRFNPRCPCDHCVACKSKKILTPGNKPWIVRGIRKCSGDSVKTDNSSLSLAYHLGSQTSLSKCSGSTPVVSEDYCSDKNEKICKEKLLQKFLHCEKQQKSKNANCSNSPMIATCGCGRKDKIQMKNKDDVPTNGSSSQDFIKKNISAISLLTRKKSSSSTLSKRPPFRVQCCTSARW